MNVRGTVAAGYEPVREVFTKLVEEGRETGAALSIWTAGREVVRLNGGWSDVARSRPWTDETLVTTYSTSKPFAALTALAAVAGGALELDEPVGRYWTEFSRAGKENTTLRQILTHRSGLPAFPPETSGIDLLDDAALRRSLADATPEFEPGTGLAEQALTHGHLLDGVLRAATGRSLGEIYTEQVRPALGIDAWFGVPEPELGRVAELELGIDGTTDELVAEVAPTYRRALALPAGALDPARLNTPAWQRSVFGASGLHASATALAGFYAELTSPDGPVARLLGPELHADFLGAQVCGHDEVVGTTVRWTLGPFRTDAFLGLGGFGGSAAWWSLRHGHAVGYVTRRLHDHGRIAEVAAVLGDDLRLEVTCD
ncbi:serine hydrolase domain-containing protein [Amycolatopsis sp. YIM 10]|uniref:serine hydrolase domain-containing protein n=1 Tax=Amycolatopsis sp. YIM 10 TaxID=2653857 RepID=UPI0012901228|nr:serine hydrolase domain-containing protein [Amycolatopsis sp. YIM 10]QFU89687.1 Esterase EstB [Amycolatopsis sp. YIM 10]